MSGKAQLTLKDRSPDTKDALQWKWANGSLTAVGEFGDPRAATSYQLCIYDQSGRVLASSIPAGGVCGGKFCWSALGTTGFKYSSKVRLPDGSLDLLMKQGVDGKAKIQLKTKGGHLGPPGLLGLLPPVRVQLTNTAGGCWEAVYSAPVLRQTAEQFRDRAD